MTGAEYLCKVLKSLGVEYVFGLFGDVQTDFAHAVRESGIKWIGVHNEKSGGFMADIYARVSKKPGIIFSTLGPGGTNLTSALANATQDRSPLIAISDQVLSNDINLEAHQFVDFEKAFHPSTGITKFAVLIKSINDIPKVFNKAFEIAQTEPMGAVHIAIPADIFGKKIDADKKNLKLNYQDGMRFSKISSSLTYSELVKRLKAKNRGLIIVGGPVERASAQKEFVEFVEHFKLPVLKTFRGKNVMPSSHPQCIGTVSRHLAEVVTEMVNDASFVLTVGYEYNEGIKPSLWKGREKDVININSYDNRIKKIFYPPSHFGNLKKIFSHLASEEVPDYKSEFNFEKLKKKVDGIVDEGLDVDKEDLHPGRIIDAVGRLYKDGVIICDVGLNKYYSGLLLGATDKSQIIFSNGQSAMAFTSGAMGAKIADPSRDVIALVGDGGFLMNPQEILTAVEQNKQVIWIIFNNGGLGLIEQAQQKNAGKGRKVHGVHFSKVFFEKLARSYGLVGKRIEPGQDLYKILKAVKRSGKSAVIDVPVVYTPKRKTYLD